MNERSEIERALNVWFEDGPTRMPDRVVTVVADRIGSTRQRRRWRLQRRLLNMNLFVKVGAVVAAVVLIAVVGYNLLPGTSPGVGGPALESPSPSLPPSAAPSPSASDLAFFPDGPIEAGRHSMIRSGKSLSVDMPAGWTSHDGFRIYTRSGEAAFIFWTDPPANVYAAPCTHEPLDPPAGNTPAELATAVSSIPGTDLVSAPSDVTIGGHPAKLVSIRVPEDVGCSPNQFYLWYNEADGPAGGRWPDALGDTINVWIIDVDGTIVWIDGEASRNTTPELQEVMQQIVESIQFD